MRTVEIAAGDILLAADADMYGLQRLGPLQEKAIDRAELALYEVLSDGDDRTLLEIRDREGRQIYGRFLYTGYSLESGIRDLMKHLSATIRHILYVPSCLLSICRGIRLEESITYRVLPRTRYQGIGLPAGARNTGFLSVLDLDTEMMEALGRLSEQMDMDKEDVALLVLSEEIAKLKKKLMKKLKRTP